MFALDRFLAIVGVFALLDAIIDSPRKALVAEFIFGFHNITARDFDHRVIHALLSPFMHNDRLILGRVVVFSALMSISVEGMILLMVIPSWAEFNADIRAGGQSEQIRGVIWFVGIFATSAAMDIFGFTVARLIFWKKRYSAILHPAAIVLNIAVSTVPFLSIVLMVALANHDFSIHVRDDITIELSAIITVAALVQLGSLLLLSAIQVTTTLSGLVLRLILMLTRLNRYTVLFTRAHEIPFTFLGIITATTALALQALLS
jgi:hypothetical protein